MTDANLPGSAPRPSGATASLEEQVRAALAPNLQLVRLIGAGGMAQVFLAREPALKRLVAVKVLSADLAASAEARARFEREAQAVASLSHPNIVAVHSVGELADGTPYFVMQHVNGSSLAARVEQEGPLSLAEARRALGEVAAALAAAHAQDIIHRDIKPANILYEEATGRSLVSDFGIAAVASKTAAPSARLTGTGVLVGTPAYMSPEQLLAEPVTAKTDIYSLGLLAHELLVGRGPFSGTTPNELIASHLRDRPPRLSSLRPEVDVELDELIARCLEKEAALRPTAEEIARRLSPGSNTLLEWPPPGLEDLHGAMRRMSVMYLLGSALLLCGLLPAVLAGPRIPSALVSISPLVFLLAAAAGLVALAVAIRRTARVGGDVSRALRAGYRSMTILETMADPAADTGNIITGSREYAALKATERSRLRVLRVVAALSFLAAGVLGLPLFFAIVILGSLGHATPGAVWLSIVVPLVVVLVGLWLAVREERSFAAERRRRSATAPTSDASRMASPWYDSFESVRIGQPLGRGPTASSGVGRVGALAASLLVVTVIILALPLFVIAILGPTYWSLTLPKYANTKGKVEIANVTRPFGVAKDPRISPLAAGQALDALIRSLGRERPSRFATRPEPTAPYGRPPWSAPIPENLFVSARSKQDEGIPATGAILQAAARGFRPEELTYLERFAHAGQWRDYAIVASAPRVDYIGARYQLPFADSAGGWWEFPIPSFNAIKSLAYAGVSRAAYHLARGQRDSAEVALRQIVSFGFAFVDDGDTLIEELIGAVIVGIGRQGLIDYYHVTNDPRGARIAALRDSMIAVSDGRNEQVTARASDDIVDLRDPVTTRAMVRSVANDPTELRALRMEMLHVLAGAPCTNVRELVFGPDEDVRSAFALARRNWARFASDTAMLDLAYASPDRMESLAPDGPGARAVVAASRAAGALLRNRRLSGCTAMFLGWLKE